MATYIILSTLTDDGAQTIKDHPERIKAVNEELKGMGIEVKAQYAVMGPIDFVSIVEAPDNTAMIRASTELSARGSVKVQTLAAIPMDAFTGIFAG